MKYTNIKKRISHNYNYLKNKTIKSIKNISLVEIQKMNLFYESTKENCLCGENKIESAKYRTDIPYRHRLLLGTQFPDLQIPNLKISLHYNDLIIDYQIDDSKNIIENENIVYNGKKYVLNQ